MRHGLDRPPHGANGGGPRVLARGHLDQELRALAFKEVEEARMFELALRERVRDLAPLSEDDGLVT